VHGVRWRDWGEGASMKMGLRDAGSGGEMVG
jgi:hypothetical protein